LTGNSLVERQVKTESTSNDGHERRTIEIFRDELEAAHLLDAADRLYPEAAQDISTGIKLALRMRRKGFELYDHWAVRPGQDRRLTEA
jgi:hypothetical protein